MFNKTETRVLTVLGVNPSDLDAVKRIAKGEYDAKQTNTLPMIAMLGFSISDIQESMSKKLLRAGGSGITGYKYVMGKTKVGMFPIKENGEVSKYGTWLHLSAFKIIMNLETLPEMSAYVPKQSEAV